MATDVTTDTSVLVKGLAPPRRRVKDKLYDEQLRLHLISKEILRKIETKEYVNHVPLLALIETASVISRLTDDAESVNEAVSFIVENSRLYPDLYLFEISIEIGRITKASGFDVLFLACAETSGSVLLTDDRKMYVRAIEYGLKARFLRDQSLQA